MIRYDLIIIGGGMVGVSLACALRETNLHIALVDATALNVQEDPRLIALNYSSYCLLENLGVWQKLSPHAAAIQQVHVSDRGRMGMLRIKSEDLGLPVLGYVVPAKNINAALHDAISDKDNIRIFRPAKLKQLTQHETHTDVSIETENGSLALEGKLLIGADGSHSTVREQLGIAVKTLDYQQSAIVTITELQRPHQHIAYERFHSSGALAMLPLRGERCAAIWTDENAVIQELLQLDDAAFLQALQKQFGYRLGRLSGTGKRHSFPLHLLKSAQTIRKNVILIGNAAHTLHPIAAQGLNLALSEIAMLAQIISAQPEEPVWETYLAWQEKQTSASTQLSHQLPALFMKDFFPLNLARQLGMIGLDICPPAKRGFARKAIGRTGNLPRLLLDKNL